MKDQSWSEESDAMYVMGLEDSLLKKETIQNSIALNEGNSQWKG